MQNRIRVTDIQNSLLDSVGEGEGVTFQENSIETCILSRVKQTTGSGWMHETSARAWCTGKTQRDRVEREVVGGIGMGNTLNPWLIHVNVWQKPLQYCKVISLQLIKLNGKKAQMLLSIKYTSKEFCVSFLQGFYCSGHIFLLISAFGNYQTMQVLFIMYSQIHTWHIIVIILNKKVS